MSDPIRCTCPTCGKETLLVVGQKEFFCSHCGGKHKVSEVLVQGRTSNACAILTGNYVRYVEACEKIFNKLNVGNAFMKVLGLGDKFASDSLHATYRERLELDVTALVEDLQAGLAPSADAHKAVSLVLQLDDTISGYQTAAALCVTLTSYEHLILPLLSFVEAEALQELCAAYMVHRRELHMPNQKTVEEEMRRLIVQKGGQVPRNETRRLFRKKGN